MAAPVTHDIPGSGSTSPTAASTTSAPQVLRDTDPADYPLAADVRSNVLVYSAAAARATPTAGRCSPN